MLKKVVTKARRIPKAAADRKLAKEYALALRGLRTQRDKNTHMAVVVHLFYIESWPVISDKLRGLEGHKFDLYVTMPSSHVSFIDTIHETFADARIMFVPNRGRDVLPFLKIAGAIESAGYTYLLKVHSKKSTHRSDGQEWLSSMLDSLLPADPRIVGKLIRTIEKPSSALVGPGGQYLPLTVNFEANGAQMTRLLECLYPEDRVYDVLQVRRAAHGFFAGTMFWVRLDAITPLLSRSYGPRQFELEAGQIDGTFAHAAERVFCLVPQMEGKDLYAVSATGIDKVRYDSGTVPDWSNVYIGPEN